MEVKVSDAFPNSIQEGILYSPDLEPDGPEVYQDDDAPSGRVSQTEPYGYDDLPNIAGPKHRVS